jgi:hypothetical protein
VVGLLGTVALSWAGVALAVGEATVTAGMVAGAITALVTSLGVQAGEMVSLPGDAVDDSAFPSGRWPDPCTSTYGHAS